MWGLGRSEAIACATGFDARSHRFSDCAGVRRCGGPATPLTKLVSPPPPPPPPPARIAGTMPRAKSVVSASSSSTISPGKIRSRCNRKTVDTCVSDTLDAFSRTSLQELVELLEEDPQKIFPTLAFARKPLEYGKPKTAQSGEEPFHHTYRKMYRIPKEVAQEVLVSYTDPDGLDLATIKACERKEDGVSRNLFYFAHNIGGHTPWPKFAHDRAVFRATFAEVHQHYGKRATTIVTKVVDGEHAIDWSKCGAYVMEPADGYPKTHLVHCSGKKIALQGSGVEISSATVDWGMVDNYDETKAKIRVKKSVTPCLELFPKDFQAQTKTAWRQTEFLQRFANKAQAQVHGAGDEDEQMSENGPEPAALTAAALAKSQAKRKAAPLAAPPAAAGRKTARRTT